MESSELQIFALANSSCSAPSNYTTHPAYKKIFQRPRNFNKVNYFVLQWTNTSLLQIKKQNKTKQKQKTKTKNKKTKQKTKQNKTKQKQNKTKN